MMLEESLVHSFLSLSYNEANFFKRSLSLTKSLVYFYNDEEYKNEIDNIQKFCANLLQTKNGKKFIISYHVLEHAYLKNYDQPPDTSIEFEITNYDGLTETFELSLVDVVNYLVVLHDMLLKIVINIAKKHGIALGDVSLGPTVPGAPKITGPSATDFTLPNL